jgi:glycosyltransferase involved in cell wall biosynthesis/predicted SAM-dependent methyltransferase
MRIVIDLQGAQTESRFRGIGRYSLSLALAMARNAEEHEIWLVLNGAFPDSVLAIRSAFQGIFPQEHIRVFEVPVPVAEHSPINVWRARAAEKVRESFIQELKPDVVLVTSLFEGYVDDAVTSVGTFVSDTGIAVILYDLIPYLNSTVYLSESTQRQYYDRKIKSLKNADLLLAISEHSRKEAVEALALPRDRVVNISTAADPKFRPTTITPKEAAILRRRFGISRKMVLYAPGGFDVRKNFDGLIHAYALLPRKLRLDHQLIIVSKISDYDRANLCRLRKDAGLAEDELILTGYVSDDDLVMLYRLATLFVFPSKHEGFGLPALEAMACGVPTIGSDTTSIPEAIGLPEAMFDPSVPRSIADKMEQCLRDENLRSRLREHGLRQAGKFSWDKSAKLAISALETLFLNGNQKKGIVGQVMTKRPKMAYVTPLPPERSGISDYSAELVPELIRHYEIEVIVAQRAVSDPWINEKCPIRSIEWFQEHGSDYERVLYHFGNSPYHSHMFGLLQKYPGAVVLHDFFLSSVLAYEEITGGMPGALTEALYRSHGYAALQQRFHAGDLKEVERRYPCNLMVLQDALGVIVHSEFSRQLANDWYGEGTSDDWVVIPLFRSPAQNINRTAARSQLKINNDDFVICSFGMLGPAKLNHRLLNAWLSSALAKKDNCRLIFVGENHGGGYGEELVTTIRGSGCGKRTSITGWVDMSTFRNYLSAADIGVQLRTNSRGEMSAAILDCMNYGLPTIVNANGASSELPDQAVWKIQDDFADSELMAAMETLWQDARCRKGLSEGAKEVIQTLHQPGSCANRYVKAIEAIYKRAETGRHGLIKAIAASDNQTGTDSDIKTVAKSIAISCKSKSSCRQMLVDVSAITRNDLRTGIERVVRAQLSELMRNPPAGFRVEPVFLTDWGGRWHYRYARKFICRFLEIGQAVLSDEPIDINHGDVFYGADFFPGGVIEAARSGLYERWAVSGISINFLVYDLLPVLKPESFPTGAADTHAAWLKAISETSSRLICISNAVADELRSWLERNRPARSLPLVIDAVHLGADFTAVEPSRGLTDDAKNVLAIIRENPSFLMVGTIEPRKGHLQTLGAFERIWDEGRKMNLVIVGPEGWKHLRDPERRTIPDIVRRLLKHKERGKQLFWLKDISDEYLEKIYEACTCLIAASEGEGFGLPLIEAARHKLPIIARDIPVFREVARENASYFNGLEKDDLARTIKNWCDLHVKGKAPSSSDLPWDTWAQNAKKLSSVLMGNGVSRAWVPEGLRRKAWEEHLNLIHNARVAMVRTLLPKGDHILDLGGANCPLYKMGYPHHFSKLTLIDLAPDQRHDLYKEIVVDSECSLGQVVLHYTDMTKLDAIDDESVDFAWSGQSIEHVSRADGASMCREVYRVLRKGGAFCLDTPNRRMTEIHTRSTGGGYIHPEHHVEYYPEEIMEILKNTGFLIKASYGICEMPETLSTGEFHYEDFLLGKKIIDNVADGYIQFYHCLKL